MMIKRIILAILVFVSFKATAQQDMAAMKKRMIDSIKSVYLDAYALKYPIIRQAGISRLITAPGSIDTKLDGDGILKGRYWVSQTTAFLSVPINDWGKNKLSGSVGAISQSFHLKQVDDYSSPLTAAPGGFDKTSLTATLIYSRNDSLFGKPVTINVSATELFSSNFSRSKFAGTGLVLFTLKRTADMSLSVGGVFVLDASANIPFAPFMSYWHKINSLNADLFVDIPSRIALRKEFKKKYSIIAFTELSGTQSFFNLQAPLPEKSIYSTLDLKTGVLLEYQFSKKAVFSISGGAFKYLSSKMAERGKKINDDYFVTNKTAMVPYINIGISLLPFWKGFR